MKTWMMLCGMMNVATARQYMNNTDISLCISGSIFFLLLAMVCISISNSYK